jgi:hypothetical protein
VETTIVDKFCHTFTSKPYENLADMLEDKIDKTAINLFGATMYGILIGVCAPITIPTFVIVAYNEITKKFD